MKKIIRTSKLSREDLYSNLVERFEESGLSKKDFAKLYGICPKTIRRRQRAQELRANFKDSQQSCAYLAKVEIDRQDYQGMFYTQEEERIEVILKGDRRISVGASFHARVFKEVVKILEGIDHA